MGTMFGSLLLSTALIGQVQPPPNPPAPVAPVVTAPIELPTVGVKSFQSTYLVPNGGTVLGGGYSSGGQVSGPGYGAGGFGSTSVSTTTQVHDWSAYDAQVQAQAQSVIGGQMEESGLTAEAIDYYRQQLQTGSNVVTSRRAARQLARMKGNAEVALAQIQLLEANGNPVEAALQLEQWIKDYGSLVYGPEVFELRRRLRARPQIAEILGGDASAQNLLAGKRAEAEGKQQVALIYYRNAAKYAGTVAGQEANVAIARLEGKLPISVEETAVVQTTPNSAVPYSVPSPQPGAFPAPASDAPVYAPADGASSGTMSAPTAQGSNAFDPNEPLREVPTKPKATNITSDPIPVSPAEVLGKPNGASSNSGPAFPPATPSNSDGTSTDAADRYLQLARLFRATQPQLAVQYYRDALGKLTIDSPQFGDVERELDALLDANQSTSKVNP